MTRNLLGMPDQVRHDGEKGHDGEERSGMTKKCGALRDVGWRQCIENYTVFFLQEVGGKLSGGFPDLGL